ncbi:MAG: sulfatase [Bacteroidales bacterium]|nr:sulfatase [Bacteroidales bacterium]
MSAIDKSLMCCSAFAAFASAAAAQTPDSRPNILLFMVDDMGWQDTSVPFTPVPTDNNLKYLTPNMERLAESGMKFTQAYACAISSPSRCSLMTGINAARHGVTNWTFRRDISQDEVCDSIAPPEWNYNGISRVPGINNTFVGPSFVQELKDYGYHTIHIGKAHFGAVDTPGEDPHHWGFEVNVAGTAAGGLATYLSEANFGHDEAGNKLSPFAVEGLEKYWGTGTFATEALTLEAVRELDKAKKYNQPWFLYMSHYAVHIPIDRDPRFYRKHIDRGLTEKEAAYASLVEGMDKSLGDLLDWVEENGEADNTIIIFMSDNGGLAASSYWRDGELHTQNAPLRSGKGSLLEGGIREPMIVRWPGRTRAGSECGEYVMIEDFYPSIIEMAGIDPEKSDHYGHSIDGRSFVPLIDGTGDPSADRALIWNYPNVWGLEGPGIDLSCAIRKNEWKLIYNYATHRKELYNIKTDIGESRNLAADYPEVVEALSKELGASLRAAGAGRPSVRSTGQPCPWPDEVLTIKMERGPCQPRP